MKTRFIRTRSPGLTRALALALSLALAMPVSAMAQVVQTPTNPQELPVEIEIELGTGSLKQAPLWKEKIQLLQNPGAPVVRRPSFNAAPLPPLNVWDLNYNPLTAQPMRLRPSDGEISWDQPGPLFDPDQAVPVDAFNVPTALRTIIGEIVTDANNNLVVNNPASFAAPGTLPDPRIPANGTIVAVPATNAQGQLVENGVPVTSLETPINETDFFRDVNDAAGIPTALLNAPRGRAAAELLGKALFWDMQVGSDGVQACGTCHFHGGVDNRTRNQLNPDTLGGDNTLQVKGPNQDVVAADFPFRRLANLNLASEGPNASPIVRDSNDVMSSMGVRFRTFVDIPTPGFPAAFGPAVNGIRPLLPDIGTADPDPVGEVFQGLRRVEPRNTPTMHGAAFNLDNFWDGRAKNNFNGGSVFGASDPFFHVFVNNTGAMQIGNNIRIRTDMDPADPKANMPARIAFSSLASQATGPPLSNFEMSFNGRNWAKIGKKLLQAGVTPLANQLVSATDSVMGPFANAAVTPGKPGLNISYVNLIKLAFKPAYWRTVNQHLNQVADPTDGFDGVRLVIAAGAASPTSTTQFTQMEGNFSLFFGLAVQAYEQLLIPDDTPFDKFMDANPLASNGIGQPGEQGVLFPTLIRQLVTGSPTGNLTLVPGFGPDEVFGFDIFAAGNLTAALPVGARNPAGFGSNPFTRTARCSLCHAGPEQTDASINFAHGLLKGDAEFEFPTPPEVVDPSGVFGIVPAPEPPGPFKVVSGFLLADEVNGNAQDAVELEPRNMFTVGNSLVNRIVAAPQFFAFGDQGVYNIGLRPITEDIGRGGLDPFGWPLSNSALALINIAGDGAGNPATTANFFQVGPENPNPVMTNFNPALPGGGLFEPTGADQSLNPGLDMDPTTPLLPNYMWPWISSLPAGEIHPQIDELAFSPNTITFPNGGPAIEFGENLFGSDLHCGLFDPAQFGNVAPNFGWGPSIPGDPHSCPNTQSGVPGNIGMGIPNAYVAGSFVAPLHGTWPMPNRVVKNGSFKVPQLRNVELTGPYFHTGSYLTLRQVVDFYMRGGDFPLTNAAHRDPHILNITQQAFGFGRTISINGDLAAFADALPDSVFQYNNMPDLNQAQTPEPVTTTPEQAKVALVKFLLALTDARVKFERAPFDRPEIFVPMDGTAPDNTAGRPALITASTGPGALFQQVPAVGAAGNPTPLSNFLGISSTPVAGPNNDHFDQ